MTTALPTFTHVLDVEASLLTQLSRAILATILFHRLMGSVKPKTSSLLGVYYVSVSDSEVERVVESKSAQLLDLSRTHPNLQLTVSVHSPSLNVRSGPYDEASASSPPSPSVRSPNVRPNSGSYPSWLAQALAGSAGMGPTPTMEKDSGLTSTVGDFGGLAGPAFENWLIRFNLVESKTEREKNKANAITGEQFSSFLNKVLSFTDSYKTHIPPLTSSELCPYPIIIGVSQSV